MMADVVSLTGDQVNHQAEVNETCIAVLEAMLERARAGNITGAVIVGMYPDGFTQYSIGGMVGGYSVIGALDVAKSQLLAMHVHEHVDDD